MPSDRLAYWNGEYASYWLQRTAEADRSTDGESRLVETDSKTVDLEGLHRLLDLVPLKPGWKVLDLACGFGRAMPYLLDQGADVVGADLSDAMLSMVPEPLRSHPRISLLQATAENLPFDNAAFDAVVVLASFDAFEQHLALTEMLRVCRTGGYVLFGGKSAHYLPDDKQALIAERNARRKGHPNYFTDWDAMTEQLARAANLDRSLYFVRREDLASMRYTETPPAEFYSYMVLARRTAAAAPVIAGPIASEYSDTWRKYGARA